MKNLLQLAFVLTLSSCSLPDTALWNDRRLNATARMPAEMTTKVLFWGNVKSTVHNPISGTSKGLNMWQERSALLTEALLPPEALKKTPLDPTRSISQNLDLIGLPKANYGSIEYLIDGKSFYTDLFKEIKNAKRTVDTRIFIFDNDDVATQYADLLKQKSATVRCRVVMDELGSISSWWTPPATKQPKDFIPPSSMPHYLEEKSKVRVRGSKNPWLTADHTKLFVIDHSIAYLGGMNIGREYRYEWHDMMVKIKGPIVNQLQDEFNHAWVQQGPFGDLRFPFRRKRNYPQQKSSTDIPIRILKTDSLNKQIETAMIAAVRLSKKHIYLQNSYITSELLIDELINARKRGVKVSLVMPEENDSQLLHSANHLAARALISAGVNVYSYPKFSHIKAIIVDDWSCLGSANFDGLSLRINSEINVSFEDKNKTNQLRKQLFLTDIKKSKRVSLRQLKKPPRLLKSVTGQL